MTKSDFYNYLLELEIKSNSKLVCYILLHHHNNKTGDCYPSQDTISKQSNLCRNSVASAIKELQGAGIITVKKMRPKGSKFTVNYYIFSFQCSPNEQSNEQSNECSNECSNERSPDEHKPIEPIEPKKVIEKYTKEFLTFWELFPRKVAKAEAEKVFARKMKLGAEFEAIIIGVKNYIEKCRGQDKKFIAHAATWLNQERWNDEIEKPRERKAYNIWKN